VKEQNNDVYLKVLVQNHFKYGNWEQIELMTQNSNKFLAFGSSLLGNKNHRAIARDRKIDV
jgi:hypothetical protein